MRTIPTPMHAPFLLLLRCFESGRCSNCSCVEGFRPIYENIYPFGIVLLELGDGCINCLPHFIDGLLDAEVDGFCFEVLMVLGVLSDAGGAERHEAAFWMGLVVLSLQKFVMA